MPVRLEAITHPSKQDAIDLEKIYHDFQGDISGESLQKQSDDSHILYAGRFNDRLLGAMQVVLNDSQVDIRYLCVREITRKRHVARDMLRLLLGEYPGKNFVLNAPKDNPALQGLMRLMEFQETPEGYCYNNG